MLSPATRQDTIAAIATAPGVGALGIIRVSGSEAISKINQLFPKKNLEKVKPYTLHFGPLQHNGFLLDEVLLSIFHNPKSYTGENLVEISCHGSPFILQKVMETLVDIDIRPAEPGEFTLRAFMNGKLDLAQAEAVSDLIFSESESAHKAALEQMRGGFSQKIRELRAQLLQFASLIELELDFAEEDVEFANRDSLKNLLLSIYTEVEKLLQSFKLGNVMKAGVKVVIAGRPNAGKSTLLNALLNEERAIVSDIPGTTRDTIEDTISIEGIQFRFIDTAGIRATTDVLENIGIERTMDKLREANLILYLFDVNELSQSELENDIKKLPQDKYILVLGNKIDRDSDENYRAKFQLSQDHIFISSKEKLYIDTLKNALVKSLHLPDIQIHDTVVTNIRHVHALQNVKTSIENIQNGIEIGITTDLIASDIRHALHHMGEITGEITNDEILGNIFSKFCIGK
ncbi:MAG: tRNA uridine-5-carboxymethylaminomethyl(34) synthesis GTPase MnmE [Sphingobacteriales bacterium]|nr:MAG: tRNA uridine-5-carboxymethylaminomethyl(34) synthesis GTPase MnmE [Sphingobacteriales bacterium]